ncbi:bifunctional protein-disulfide isomerase/oxidoreductase DsbC [Vibrio mangrovi]|uniref:Thiol:disulfide interchange protein n=1 Tax=Vibrio mangrovi TaxID=474394 RepID=A0A1Y6IXM9_9VIBR|nr:bifunctional protein-disulfide isomerase/oxidoreductase DsbC [Vibrio mangrovi]MDW6003001.1 bifunctional protein-disulfide isomerase/oxidoreductase DsbC [Vibrio mangrovi]SMS01242.1 Thiol:disulfide interchange protein DsbC precursor [Vibrio mangrovi]
MRAIRELVLLGLVFFSMAASAADSFDKQELTQRFKSLGLTVKDIVPSEVDGLLEIQTSNGILFSSPKGDYFIAGTLYKLKGNGQYEDVIAKRQAPINAKRIEQLKDQMIEYKADNEKYVVTVFTDITCGYCIRLHSQLKGYNDLGITIRYLAFPRQGPNGQVAEQMAAIWCSDDPAKSLSDAKMQRDIVRPDGDIGKCKKQVANHYQLGRELGVSGTPAIFLPNGEMVGGYLPPEKLLERLKAI